VQKAHAQLGQDKAKEKYVMNEKEFMDAFARLIVAQAMRKAELYDGIQMAGRGGKGSVLFFLGCATEEIGEVASAIMRKRLALAFSECIDLAHTAMLVAYAIYTTDDGVRSAVGTQNKGEASA
jgi:hypothetical protein